jgi:hypothetical protein
VTRAVFALSAVIALTWLTGCAGLFGVQGGAALLATPRGNEPVVGMMNGHLEIGGGSGESAVLFGLEGNTRVTSDYGHVAAGMDAAWMHVSEKGMGYARLAVDPLGLSVRQKATYYALDTGLEVGLGWSWNGKRSSSDYNILTEIRGDAVTLSVRGDVELRPAQPQADAFVGLMLGFATYDLLD